MALKEGIVVRAASGLYTVEADGHAAHCTLRGNLKKEFEYSTTTARARKVTRARRPWATDAVSVGDHVRFAETHRGAGVIEEVLPRKSSLTRAGFRGREQTIVSNIDQVMIVVACAEPRLDPWKLDRFLVAAEIEEIPAVIVANKQDLVTEGEIKDQFDLYEQLDYRVVPASARRGEGIAELRVALHQKVSAFVGPSGAGKSSLLNAIQPGLRLRTGEIGYVTHKGRHTTTAAQLIPLRFGGWVADTPGLRSFEMIDLDPADLAHGYREMPPLLGTCRFDNCSHRSEPGCAIKEAVERGQIDSQRYRSYQILRDELSRGSGSR